MELHQIKSFVTVAQTRNLTRAAAQLNTTPPSVSAHIRQLEERFNMPLFTRTPKGMEITDQGRILEKKARAVLETVQDLSRTADQVAGQVMGDLKLGINAAPEYLRVPDLIQGLHRRFPALHIEVLPSNTGDIMDRIQGGELDCGYIFGTHHRPDLAFRELGEVGLEIVVPERFRSSHSRAAWEDIASLPWIVPTTLCPFLNQVRGCLSNLGLDFRRPVQANDDITKTALIQGGAAATVLEKSEALAFEQAGKGFIWKAPAPIATCLSIGFAQRNADRPGLKILVKTLEKLWRDEQHLSDAEPGPSPPKN